MRADPTEPTGQMRAFPGGRDKADNLKSQSDAEQVRVHAWLDPFRLMVVVRERADVETEFGRGAGRRWNYVFAGAEQPTTGGR
jgi:hypothetical protein